VFTRILQTGSDCHFVDCCAFIYVLMCAYVYMCLLSVYKYVYTSFYIYLYLGPWEMELTNFWRMLWRGGGAYLHVDTMADTNYNQINIFYRDLIVNTRFKMMPK